MHPVLAHAQAPDAATRAAARSLGNDGVKAYQAGDYDLAAERLGRAYQVLKVPTLGLWLARSLSQQGKLVEASELLLEVTRLSGAGGDESVQLKAQKDADVDRTALLPRIPRLGVQLSTPSAQAKVSLDSREVPSALLGVQSPINPGKHVVMARTPEGASASQEVTLAEGAALTVTLELKSPTPSGDGTQPGLVNAPPPQSPTQPSTPPNNPVAPSASLLTQSPASATHSSDSSASKTAPPSLRWIGYTALAIGGAGLISGAVLGLSASAKRHSAPLSEHCTDDKCSSLVTNEVNNYNSLRSYSTVGFGVGIAGLIGGAVLVFALPGAKNQEKPVAIEWQAGPALQRLHLRMTF